MIFVKNILFAFCFTIIATSLVAQKKMAELEVNPFVQMDWYPEFTYRINPVNYNKVRIRGESFGINTIYSYPLKDANLNIGMGYYRYSFTKIKQQNTSFGKSNNRIIDYVPPGPFIPSILYATDKYWYHTISLNIGVQKYFDLKNDWQLSTGINLANYFTIAQTYHIRDFKYKQSDFRYFGFSASLELGLIKRVNNIHIGPILILPVYDLWKQDRMFPKNANSLESNSATRHKWLRGVGMGISIKFPIGKK